MAGCGTSSSGTPTGTPLSESTATGTTTSTEVETSTPIETPEDLPEWLPVPKSELTVGAAADAIPAIVFPKFAVDWSGLTVRYYDPRFAEKVESEPRLSPDDRVVGVTHDGEARAYPLKILVWHEIVNDDFGGPLLVTYCPLCATAITAKRRVNGEATRFGVSGLLYRSNLVMYDEATDSLWSQARAIAIRGPKVGTRLQLRPSTLTTWGEWTADYPDTKVLLPPPKSSTVRGPGETRNYSINPYASFYKEGDEVGVKREAAVDGRLHPKTLVLGIAHDGAAKAYPLPSVLEAGGLVNDTVNDLPVVVVATGDGGIHGFVRSVDGERLQFEPAGDDRIRAGGSTWDPTTGEALDGPHEGAVLEPANDRSAMYWFAWADIHPETAIYGGTRTATNTERPSG